MKITFLIRSLDYGGAERQLVALARELHRYGHSVAVLIFYSGGPLQQDLEKAGVPVISLEKRGRWDVLGFLGRLIRFLRRERPDILHGYLVTANILTVLLKPLFPDIRMVWGVRVSNLDFTRYNRYMRLTHPVECRLSRFADRIIVNSHAGSNYAISRGFPQEKTVVIPNGIDTERFRPDPESGKPVRAEWGLSNDEKLIGLVGRLDPMKAHPTFLEAAALLVRERKDVRFVCVGDGPADYRQELYALGKALDLTKYLIWAGAREDMSAVYNALDLATSSSSFGEGFPNVVGEAMACGVPCVVTDVGDSAWIVRENGMVVPPSNPVKLMKAWSTLLNLPYKDYLTITKASRQHIINNYNLDVLYKKTFQALLDLRPLKVNSKNK
ncbi:MAG: glycosyltransferase [Desulfotomaculaceae bacterium]|nr:glycosyltransferase [Desulfotomaculaceae bacterium]